MVTCLPFMCAKIRRVVKFDTGFLFIIMALRDFDVVGVVVKPVLITVLK